MKLKDLKLHNAIKIILSRFDFDNQPDNEQEWLIDFLIFTFKNNEKHFKNRSIPMKSAEENYADWLAYEAVAV